MLIQKGTKDLDTERLYLRRFKLEDSENMFNNWANDEDVTKYLTWLPHKKIEVTNEILKEWINSYKSTDVYNWAIVPKEYGKVIGNISVVKIDLEDEMCEIGYCISKKYWNKGIVTEALKKVIDYLILDVGFVGIKGKHDLKNIASGKVMLKAGMTYEGRIRDSIKNNEGEYIDVEMYSILKRDIFKNKSLNN
ncbi:GNAT family N-acetyltransferase [Haliovirga abyssi]|uniref:GNAT family acetyltransferase n=1 Tax=Haliovirga abyssi TaxID=2996794 RepID=A0AAU9DKK2_9FUSO|nr:GNAT family N-acetyltransferase [Haliovirga abyssi]BDU50427.1 GNAT family acetyltransferase [Haliovirga abyssi]